MDSWLLNYCGLTQGFMLTLRNHVKFPEFFFSRGLWSPPNPLIYRKTKCVIPKGWNLAPKQIQIYLFTWWVILAIYIWLNSKKPSCLVAIFLFEGIIILPKINRNFVISCYWNLSIKYYWIDIISINMFVIFLCFILYMYNV